MAPINLVVSRTSAYHDFENMKLQPLSYCQLSVIVCLTLARGALYNTAWNLCNIDNLHYNLGSTELPMLSPFSATWALLICHFARVHFQWAIAVEKWIPYHIQQGNAHYSRLIKWSLESEFGLCTLGNIPFCYCVLVQWEIPWTVILAALNPWLQHCSAGHEYSPGYENFRWIIAWSLCPTPLQSWLAYCTPSKVSLYYSEHLQGHNQRTEVGNIQLLIVKISYSVTASSYVCTARLFAWAQSLKICHYAMHIAWDFRGGLLFSLGCDAATDHVKFFLSIPWDPGGAVWWWLEGKPPFKEGGMLAPASTTTVGPNRQWPCWYETGLGQQQRRMSCINTRQKAAVDLAWNGTASASLLSVFLFLLSSSSFLCNG
jgi:hypothetical protein